MLANDGVQHNLDQHRGEEEDSTFCQFVDQVESRVRELEDAQLYRECGAGVGHSVVEGSGQR